MQADLAAHGLDTFESWWQRQIDWFEAPNERRGGWSGVGRLVLTRPHQAALTLFVKKQQNHGRRTWQHPIAGEPTFRREYQRLLALAQAGIPAPHVVFYAESEEEGHQRAILVTENLQDFVDLEQHLPVLLQQAQTERRSVLRAVAHQIRRFHDRRWVHRALYPKHIFVTPAAQPPQVALIDLEKTRVTAGAWRRARFDLAALNRHAEGLSRQDRMYFFKQYLHAEQRPKRLTRCERLLLRQIATRSQRARH